MYVEILTISTTISMFQIGLEDDDGEGGGLEDDEPHFSDRTSLS